MIQDSQVQTLIFDVAVGNQQAFSKLYQLTSPILFNVIRKFIQDTTLAEDVLQESFIKIWHRAADFDADKGYAFAWLATIVRRQAIDALRKEGRKPPEITLDDFDDYLQSHWSDDTASNDDHLASELLKKCLEQLNKLQQKCILLSYFHGYSHPELVEKISKPLGTVKSWIRRGMAEIRECMK
ncbi:MAG: sigma-70 family RNA polymerase sigma factor [Thiotrichales bacterium]|nr:sigma-70 family RNA polymerase sigma factor [Thiotrichales bacterium]